MNEIFRKQRQLDRRSLLRGMMVGAIGESLIGTHVRAKAAVAQPTQKDTAPVSSNTPLIPWIFVHDPLERWFTDYQRIFDAWAEGGVRGIVVGRLRFYERVPEFDISYVPKVRTFPTFRANPAVYKTFGVAPPAETPGDPEKEKQLHAMLDNAAARGWEILFFGAAHQGGPRPAKEDPFGAVSYAAGVQDTMNAYPQAHGVIIDGAGEHHYELAFHHGGELFEIRQDEKDRLQRLGMDVARMERGIAHLRNRFHQFTPALVRYHTSGGTLGGLTLFDINEDALYWLRARQETALLNMSAVRQQINKLSRKTKLGTIPRAPAFSILTAQDYQKTHVFFDYVFPKHYFWHRGFDGMYGTVARWVSKLAQWNPSLSERDCFAVVKSWFGLELPAVHSLEDMELGFPDEFFAQVVSAETRRALDAIGDDNKVIAWVSTGRHPHAGDPMPGRDLYRILTASQQAGLKRFLYHPDPDLGAAEWRVISGLCGKRWNEDPGGYWPSDTPKPDTWNGGRKPGNTR